MADPLEHLAEHDLLTGVYNRSRLADELDRQLSYSARYSRPSALLTLDIDNFKLTNDTYGRAARDIMHSDSGPACIDMPTTEGYAFGRLCEKCLAAASAGITTLCRLGLRVAPALELAGAAAPRTHDLVRRPPQPGDQLPCSPARGAGRAGVV
jgi:hypothetical protein